MKKCILFYVFSLIGVYGTAQTVGIGTTTPNPEAILDVSSTKQGLLLTRTNLVQADWCLPLSNHVEGIVTYNTFESQLYTTVSLHDGLYYNDGVTWNLAGPNAIVFGDIKYSLLTSDHNGWYLLDGRAITALPINAQNNAIAMGLVGNLYNVEDSFLKTKTAIEPIGTINGSNQFTISQANLPNVSFTGTTNTTGDHNHQYTDEYSPTQSLGLATNVLALLPIINVTVGRPETTPANLFTTASSGSHTHNVTVNSGGSDTPINSIPKHVVTNVFIYLGE